MKERVVALTFAVALAACAGNEGSDTGANDVVVGANEVSDQVTVFADRLEFDAAAGAKLETTLAKIGGSEPVYLVGNRQSGAIGADGALKGQLRNPMGYLRRALSWEKSGGKIVVKTEAATLSDALEEIKKNGFLDLKPRANDGTDTADGAGNIDKSWTHVFGPAEGFAVTDLSGTQLYKKDLVGGGTIEISLPKGRLSLKPRVDTHIRATHFKPQEASAVVTTEVEGDVEFLANASGAFEEHAGNTLLKRSFGATVGKMPLTLDLEVKWDCGMASTGRAVASLPLNASGQVRAGAAWTGKVGGFIDPPAYAFAPVQPALDSNVKVAGTCHLVSAMKAQVFDATGPEMTVDLYSNLNVDGSGAQLGGQVDASLVAGSEIKLGGTLKPFGFKIADITAEPKKVEKQVFAGKITLGHQ